MEAKAQAKFIRMSPRKVRLVIDLIRGLDVEEAKNQLRFMTKAAVKPVLKFLNSAVANAENNLKLQKENLYIKTITVDTGPTLKRWKPRAFGRATPIRKRSCHIRIILAEKKEMKRDVEKPKIVLEKPKVVTLPKELKEKIVETKKTEKEKLEKIEVPKREVKKAKGFLKRIFSRKTG